MPEPREPLWPLVAVTVLASVISTLLIIVIAEISTEEPLLDTLIPSITGTVSR